MHIKSLAVLVGLAGAALAAPAPGPAPGKWEPTRLKHGFRIAYQITYTQR